MMGDLQRTCLHCTESSAVLDQKRHDRAPPSLFTQTCLEWLFLLLFFQDEKCSQRETFCKCGRGKAKNSRSTKRHQIQQVQKLFWAVEKMSRWVYCIKWRALWRWLKYKYVRINTHFFINAFRFGMSPSYIVIHMGNISVTCLKFVHPILQNPKFKMSVWSEKRFTDEEDTSSRR